MQIFFFLMSLSPILMLLLLALLIFYIITNKSILNKPSIITMVLIFVLSAILIWYYYPQNNILGDAIDDSVSISVGDERVEIKDQEKVEQIFKAINTYTYIRSTTRSLGFETFPGNNLIVIDMLPYKNGKHNMIHLYVLYNFDEVSDQPLDVLAKGNLLQINEQSYNIKNPVGLSRDIYGLLKEYGVLYH